MDNFFKADILATCNALGSEIKGVYEKGTDCLECLRDILRYLRKDDDNHSTLCYLGSIRLLETDLLPIVKRYSNDSEIFDFTLRLLVALTSPAILLFQEEIPDDKLSHNTYLQLIGYLQSYKRAFFDVDVWKVLHKQFEKIIVQRPLERNDKENLIIERILILIRNILHIPTDEMTSLQTDDNLSPQDKILWNIHDSKLDILILYLCANEEEYQYCLHLLEMISLMLQEHSAESVASANEERSRVEKEEDMKTLIAVRQREQNMKLKKVQTMVSARFSGVYCVTNMKSISENDYISHKLITDVNDVKFDRSKNTKRRPKNRLPIKEVDPTRRSTLAIRMLLKKFCIEFLKAYNKLMAAVKRELLRKSTEDHDDTYFLCTIEYFMKFNRIYDFQLAFVSETISLQMFHHIQTQITNYHEMMLTDKKKSKLWSKRMRLGVSAYKELLQTIYTMTRSSDPSLRHNADIIVSNVFYIVEYREMLLSLISNYDEVKFSIVYLAELVESTYMFLKMLEDHSKRHNEVIIQQRKRKVKRRKKKKPVQSKESNTVEDLIEQWASIASDLSAAVQNRRLIPSDVTPFDGASEVPFEEQKVSAIYKIRNALVSKEAEQAVGLLRTARELWPEGDAFGAADIDSEDEFSVLREIYLSNLEDPNAKVNSVEAEEQNSHEDDSDEEMLAMPAVIEKKLDLSEIYKKYASPKVVIPCCLLFANYEKNSPKTNTCLIKLLHKIGWDCKMHALFFQATLFCTFQKIFQDPEVSHNPVTKELYRFAKFILSKFFEIVKKNDKVFVELLFWKGCREAYELEEGYDNFQSSSTIRGAWTEDEEEELKYLYEENKNIHIEGQDVADIILANLDQRKRTKHQIILALKRLGLIQSAKDLKPHLRAEWQEAEVTELKHLFEDHRKSDDIMGNILNGLSIKRSRKAVVEKMLELNLIQDRKEARKKSKKSKMTNGSDSESDSCNNSDLEDEVVPAEGEDMHRKNDSESSDNDDETFFERMKAERFKNHNAMTNNIDQQDEVPNADMISSKKSEKQANQKKRPPKTWDEKEIVELSHLFNENKDADDMDVILNSLTVKRSKQNIIEKLLEVGLIKDKKEIRKKRKNKFLENVLIDSEMDQIDTGHETEGNGLGPNDSRSLSPSLIDSKKKKKKNQILSDSSDEDIAENHQNDMGNNETDFNENKSGKETPLTNLTGQKMKKRMPKVWVEQEIIELHQLFKDNKDAIDIIGNIINGLPTKRSKEDIIGKLLEVGLIKDRKEIRKKRKGKVNGTQLSNGNKSDSSDNETLPLQKLVENNTKTKNVKKRPPKIWAEGEIVELSHLFEKYKGSTDVMGALINGLSIKRSKESIIEKLLEIALIKDRKEIRKKKDKTAKQSMKEGNDGVHVKSSAESKSSRREKARKIMSDSSEDETLPLKKILKTSTERQVHNEHKRMKNKTILSDDESSFNTRTENKYDYAERRKSKIMSDSSDEETLPLRKLIPDASAFEESTKRNVNTITDFSSSRDLFQNPSMQLQTEESSVAKIGNTGENLHSSIVSGQNRKRLRIEDSDDSSNEASLPQRQNMQLQTEESSLSSVGIENTGENLHSSIISEHKRKRLRIEDSDDSSNEASLPDSILRNSTGSSLNENETVEHGTNLYNLDVGPGTETVKFQSKKKRVRVLRDSDESD